MGFDCYFKAAAALFSLVYLIIAGFGGLPVLGQVAVLGADHRQTTVEHPTGYVVRGTGSMFLTSSISQCERQE